MIALWMVKTQVIGKSVGVKAAPMRNLVFVSHSTIDIIYYLLLHRYTHMMPALLGFSLSIKRLDGGAECFRSSDDGERVGKLYSKSTAAKSSARQERSPCLLCAQGPRARK